MPCAVLAQQPADLDFYFPWFCRLAQKQIKVNLYKRTGLTISSEEKP